MPKIIRLLFLLVASMTVSGCHAPILRARSEFLDPSYRASAQIGAPDPCPCFQGEQIVIHWALPHRLYPFKDCYIKLSMIDKNYQTEVCCYPVKTRTGYWVYRLLNEQYAERKGILSYQVEMICGECVLDSWQHHLWHHCVQI